jgi:hypothetical protein
MRKGFRFHAPIPKTKFSLLSKTSGVGVNIKFVGKETLTDTEALWGSEPEAAPFVSVAQEFKKSSKREKPIADETTEIK